MVFYLKYRPNKISDLDSNSLKEKLSDVLSGKLPDDIPHAFLFTGSRGLGKTSTARIIAKAINCTDRKKEEIEPCNKCDSCMLITNGSNLDVLEIDAASNRGIDEIRDLREKIKLSPLNSLKKVYIIDEVHMLTTEAFNALLKTLEEPPKHAIFILCTTESQKLPETILSRCFNIKFSKATDSDLISSFQRIVKGENLKADKNALLELAKLSDGSFRDGVKILEEISLSQKDITKELIEEKYKTGTISKNTNDLISALYDKDLKKGIEIVSNLSNEGIDFKIFTQNLINNLHDNLISEAKNDPNKAKVTSQLISNLVKAHLSIKYAILPQLPLELSIVEWCVDEDGNHESGVMNQELEKKESKIKNIEEDKIKVQKKPDTKLNENDNILESLINSIKSENFSVAGVLRGCKIEKLDNEELILSTSFAFHKEKISDKKVTDLIEGKLKELGHEIKFSIILKD